MKELIIVKYGSECTADVETGIKHEVLDFQGQQIADLSQDYDVIAVTSGALAVGKQRLAERGIEYADEQTYSTVGQIGLIGAWEQALDNHGLAAAQVLVTHHEIEDAVAKKHDNKLLNALQANRQSSVVSVINENDALSDIEIMTSHHGGDNDGLAAHLGTMLGVGRIILVTAGADGVEDKNRRVIDAIDDSNYQTVIESLDAAEMSKLGRGGIKSKVITARALAMNGIDAHVAGARANLRDVIAGNAGTHFRANHSRIETK